ncbi:hypothetical protein [Actinomadura harenae]|uniref:Uncharacterized protein n=1 Tax=Actinomadura harenae TaxID=2483351 RepID=A0A3M2LRV3_9ACTN|nr:hypothetical protein [Actinomadura harenae]RMI39293.1 hypothetical protein EBO15_30035 [Actinomadura harenae]
MRSRHKRAAGTAAILAGASLLAGIASVPAASATQSRTATVHTNARKTSTAPRTVGLKSRPQVTASGISGKWIYSYKSPRATSRVQSYRMVELCFNVTGNHLYQGYTLSFKRRGVGGTFPHTVTLWSKRYWGPKHKTCTGWKPGHHDRVWAEIAPIKFPLANAKAQVWIYNP